MAIGVITEVDQGTLEQYDLVNEKIAAGPPADGLVFHMAAVKEDGGFRIVEVWESEEQHQRFEQQSVGPAVSEVVGPDTTPSHREIFEVHNLMVAGQG